jgi:spore coat protein A
MPHGNADRPESPKLTKFVEPLLRPPVAIPDPSVVSCANYYEITMLQRQWQFHRELGPATTWGYWATNPKDPKHLIGLGYLGPTIEAVRNQPVVINFRNQLPLTNLFQEQIDEERRLSNGRMPMLPPNVNTPTTVHLHGNFTPPQSDGLPLQWYTPDGIHGEDYNTVLPCEPNDAVFCYPNDHRGCLFWYHDHAVGITRLNVYAGLAGVFLLREAFELNLAIPMGDFEWPLILQDKHFKPDGQLLYALKQVDGGDTAVVNGKAYPYLAVEPRRYRFRILDASNTRFWRLRLDIEDEHDKRYDDRDDTGCERKHLPFWLIGGDQGYRKPLQLESILFGPAQRLDVIVDFSKLPLGTKVTLRNFDAPVHFPNGTGPEIPKIMQFHVTKPLSCPDNTIDPKDLDLPLVVPLVQGPATVVREFVLIQPHPGLEYTLENPYLINLMPFEDPDDTFIKPGATEVWEYINTTDDTHPMHIHLIDFQVVNRQKFDKVPYRDAFTRWVENGRKPAEKPVLAKYLIGDPLPAEPQEVGLLQDVVRADEGIVTRLIAKFDVAGGIPQIPGSETTLPATYVQHCHILEHEDNDKMRNWAITDNPGGARRR